MRIPTHTKLHSSTDVQQLPQAAESHCETATQRRQSHDELEERDDAGGVGCQCVCRSRDGGSGGDACRIRAGGGTGTLSYPGTEGWEGVSILQSGARLAGGFYRDGSECPAGKRERYLAMGSGIAKVWVWATATVGRC